MSGGSGEEKKEVIPLFEHASKVKTFLKIAIFGDGGSGKTRLALSFPKVALIDTEHGSDPYRGKYDFHVKHLNRWKDLLGIVEWLEKNPGIYETLAVDSLTVFYQDLINDMVEYVKNRRNHEILSQSEWAVIKRRWAAFINRLSELQMHTILSMRERDEYEDTINKQGEEIRRKTGNQLMDADKQTKYIFDIVLRAYTEESRKTKESKFFLRVDKSRYDWMPKYAVYDITQKRGYETIFAQHVSELFRSETNEPEAPSPTPVTEAPAPSNGGGAAPPLPSTAEVVGEMWAKFCPQASPDQSAISGEDVKVLMSRCNEMRWPDGEPFKSVDGKAMIKAHFKVESTKELRKPQMDWLYTEFGNVLAGRAHLARDQKGTPFIVADPKVPLST